MFPLVCALGLTLPVGAARDVQATVSASNQLALDLYQHLGGRAGNLFFSPYSITKTLAMTCAGARGDTAREMAAVLHLGDTGRQHQAFLELRELLNRSLAGGPFGGRPVQLHLAAALWGQRGYHFDRRFRDLLRKCYGAGLEEVDFNVPEEARLRINDWARRQTKDRVRDLFAPGTLAPTTRLVLASAIYFKGDWARSFAKYRTGPGTFWSNGAAVTIPLMSQTSSFGYFEDQQVQGLELPYRGGNLALVVLLPRARDGLGALEKVLTEQQWSAWLARLREREVEVTLPKFSSSSAFVLNDTLMALGMKRAFTPGQADFAGINGGREPLAIATVVHQAFVDVNEDGTEAAAATGAAVGSLSAVRPAGPVFRADHPFVFAIRDVSTGTILFLGRLARP
jgi:serpin B